MNKFLKIILFILPLFFYLIYLSIRFIQIENLNNTLFSDNCSLESLITWHEKHNYDFNTDNIDLTKVMSYKEQLPIIDKPLSLVLPNIEVANEQTKIVAINDLGKNIPQGIDITIKLSNDAYQTARIFDLLRHDQILNCNLVIPNNLSDQTIPLSGTKNNEELLDMIDLTYKRLVQPAEEGSLPPLYYPENLYNQDPNYLRLGREIFNKFSIKSINLEMIDNNEFGNGYYDFGEITLGDNVFSKDIDLIYSAVNDEYLFNLSQLNLVLLDYLKSNAKVLELDCLDCILAPVSKQFSLRSSYAPNVVMTNWNGGGSLTVTAKDQLHNMLNAANKEGINTTIISAYRSYYDQVATFNYWVNREIAAGLSRPAAEAKANNYSAYPGQSEHQLGNTVDLKCLGCGSFDNSLGNLKLYNFLKKYAHEYGFVISYPDGKKDLTGYNSEPWHLRYIGISPATIIFNLKYLEDNDVYLSKFLVEYNYY